MDWELIWILGTVLYTIFVCGYIVWSVNRHYAMRDDDDAA